MFLFSNLPDNKLLFNDTQNTFVVFKIDTTNTDKDLVEVEDLVEYICKELNKLVDKLRPFNQFVTIFYGVKID